MFDLKRIKDNRNIIRYNKYITKEKEDMNNPVNKTILLRGASNPKVSYLRPPERSVNQLFDVNAGSITNY